MELSDNFKFASKALEQMKRHAAYREAKVDQELKPCPFCNRNVNITMAYNLRWYIYCLECAHKALPADSFELKEEAIEAWNKRA